MLVIIGLLNILIAFTLAIVFVMCITATPIPQPDKALITVMVALIVAQMAISGLVGMGGGLEGLALDDLSRQIVIGIAMKVGTILAGWAVIIRGVFFKRIGILAPNKQMQKDVHEMHAMMGEEKKDREEAKKHRGLEE